MLLRRLLVNKLLRNVGVKVVVVGSSGVDNCDLAIACDRCKLLELGVDVLGGFHLTN